MAAPEELSIIDSHLAGLAAAIIPFRGVAGRLARWGGELAWTLGQGGRLLVAGNGGSAAEAQHLAAELVGKLRGDRAPLSAIALCADSSAVTAISNDYGFEQVYARQVRGHGRADDILMLMSTSGRSPNLLAAADAARDIGMRTWALTGPGPNPLAERCDEALACPSPDSQVVQELHLISVHVLCEYVDRTLPTVLGIAESYAGGARAARRDVDDALATGDLVGAGAFTGDGSTGASHAPAHTPAKSAAKARALDAGHSADGTRLGLVRGAGAGHPHGTGARP
jgi:D-sedoheptulose 7-phosphate isomerase